MQDEKENKNWVKIKLGSMHFRSLNGCVFFHVLTHPLTPIIVLFYAGIPIFLSLSALVL